MQLHLFLVVSLFVGVSFAQTNAEVKARFIDGTISTPYEYKLFVPTTYDSTKPARIVVWLAGIGERGKANGVQLIRTPLQLGKDSVQNEYPTFILAPMLPSGSWNAGHIKTTLDHVATEYTIDPNRRYITGFSWGSFGVWNTIIGLPTLFRRAVPIAGGPSAPSQATLEKLRQTAVWTFHGEADTTVQWGATRVAVEAMLADGQNVLFTHEAGRGHQDEYVWTNYPTAAWLLNDTDAAPLICNPTCPANSYCTYDGCVCTAGFTGPQCSIQIIGPPTLGNDGVGSAHICVQPNAATTPGNIIGLELFFNNAAAAKPLDLELRIYDRPSNAEFTLVSKQKFTVDVNTVQQQTVTFNTAVRILQNQHVGIVNLAGTLGMANNGGAGFGYWYVSGQTYSNTIGETSTLTYWNGAPAWRALFAPDGTPTTFSSGTGTPNTSTSPSNTGTGTSQTGDTNTPTDTGEDLISQSNVVAVSFAVIFTVLASIM